MSAYGCLPREESDHLQCDSHVEGSGSVKIQVLVAFFVQPVCRSLIPSLTLSHICQATVLKLLKVLTHPFSLTWETKEPSEGGPKTGLSVCLSQPLRRLNNPFRGRLRPSCLSDICIVIHNSNSTVGGPHSIRRVETHCAKSMSAWGVRLSGPGLSIHSPLCVSGPGVAALDQSG